MTTIDPSEKKYELDPLVTRVLKRGDLTRINSQKPGKLVDHHGDLARVVQAIPVGPTLENSHPFVYDLEVVLGGKLHGVFRADLLYTTASQEGMTDDSRARRKRTPNSTLDAEFESTKSRGKGGKKKQTTAKKGKAGTLPSVPANPNSSKKRPVGETKAKIISSKKSKLNASEDNVASASQAMDLFERHRREFERSLGRLEKTDAYNFFGTAVPPEFEEFYTNSPKMENIDSYTPLPNDIPISAQHHDITCHSQSPNCEAQLNDKFLKKKNNSDDGNDDEKIQFPSSPPFNFVVIRRRMEVGRYILDRINLENQQRRELMSPYWKSIGRKNGNRRQKKSQFPVLHPKGIDWDLFRKDIHDMCDAAVERNKHLDDVGPGTLGHAASKIKDLMEQIYEKNGRRHFLEMSSANDRHRFSMAMDQTTNTEAAVQGKWKRDAFPERKYERLKGDVVCAGLSQLDEKIAAYELKTTLEDKFIGLAYRYDDTGQSEGWMKSVLDIAGEQSQRQQAALALASDDGAIKAQVSASMQSLLIGVLDKVMTETGVLEQKELRCANTEIDDNALAGERSEVNERSSFRGPEFVVREVWGIDCYTRRNVAICLETEFDSDTVQSFTEKWLLPAINACPPDLAYDLSNACRILEGLPFDELTSIESERGSTFIEWKASLLGKALLKKITTFGPPWLYAVAHLLRRARENLGPDFFRIHPKGHGSIVLCEKLEPNRLVTFYRGEIYPSWRWGEKIDAIAKIQQQKGLKPVLPDFFNMALERPQHDPRGYGLLFVDASRKSNYGSMLSHSCQPSCEVHVVAVNGELRLAITTIREMTIGDELTFDYNAVTESLFEYQSAVCLCGHWRCSGSFLHFAAADCYQQVLNRNSPVASRLANVIKGCTKKVMSDEDDKILKRHGFQTAAFGAVSVNRRNASALDSLDSTLDSMDIVPIWLRTYVADTLRYIEYERRALPIALICNDLYDESGSSPPSGNGSDDDDDTASAEEDDDQISREGVKQLKRSKPEPTFFYYARMQRDYFISLLDDDEDKKSLTGAEQKREVQKLASVHWKSLDEEAKEAWKARAFDEWEKNGGDKTTMDDDKKKRRQQRDDKPSTTTTNTCRSSCKPKISFQQADAEGVSAMEQRIQQLTQTLSRVGRVLDRHREAALRLQNGSNQLISDEALREVTHSPLVIMPDEHVIAWVWNHGDGLVRTLLKHSENDICISPELKQSMTETISKYAVLEHFGSSCVKQHAQASFPVTPAEGREQLNEALLELRKNLLDGIQQMASVIKKHRAKTRSVTRSKKGGELFAQPQHHSQQTSIDSTVKTVMEDMIITIEKRFSDIPPLKEDEDEEFTLVYPKGDGQMLSCTTDNLDTDLDLDPWLRNFNKRFKIEKAADLLLLYAKTGHFFSIKPYQPLKSSPIEVYARDLGNAVPASTIDRELNKEPDSVVSSPRRSPTDDDENDSIESKSADENAIPSTKRSKQLCNPEDIISNVAIEYKGDYVLSQLLQWYNGGIGQKPGLPDMLGCILLPSMKGCWTIDGTTVNNSHTDRATRYQSATRRSLIEWFKDPLKRGNPWPDDVRKAFVEKDGNLIPNTTNTFFPLGSPILDFLVTGDDSNLNSVMAILSSFHSSSLRSDSAVGEGLLSTVDEGRPAEAVSNWVQCENPACQKWRKVPWYIDIDMLPEQFFCKDIVWNPKAATCDAPEDEWDQITDAQVGADTNASILSSGFNMSKNTAIESGYSFKLCDFRLGAQFDIRRAGKQSWAVGTVVKLDLSGDIKQVKLHYPKMQIKYDEWIEIDSPRIAPLYSKVQRPLKKETTDTISKLRGLKVDKPLNYKEQKKDVNELSRQKHATGQRRKTDEDTQPSGETQPVFADDSSMADVFLQDSDDDSDLLQDADDDRDSSILRNKPRPVAPRRSILHESDDNTDPDAEKEEYDELVDSDVEELKKGVSLSKCQSIPLTDDGDAGKARKKPETSNGKTSSWTIPKKRSAPVASSLIALAPVQEDDKLPPGSPLHVTKANRIPRKKLPASSAETLLFAEPKLNVAQLGQEERQRNVSSKIRMSASDSRPIGSAKPNGKGEYSTGQALARDDGARNAANSRNDASWSIGKAGDRVQLAEPHVVDGEIERLKASDVNSRNHVHSSDSSRLHSNLYSPNNSREPRVLNRTERRSGDHHDPSRYDDSLFRDREHRLESTNDSYSRQYDYTRERDNPRRFDENRLGFPSDERHRHDEGYGPARHDVNTRYHQESRGYHSSRHMSNHGRDRYNESNYTYAEGYDDRWRESHYGTSTKHFRDEGMRQRDRTSRDRERVSSRRYEQSPVEKGYDRHVDRHYREHDDHDEYWYRRHGHDRYEGHENPRYDESPRPKYRSRKSRDRSRDSGKQHFEPASEGYRQNSKERHGHQIQYNSANFDEQEFLGGNRTSRGDSEKKMPREEEPARQKGHSYMRESWRDTSQAR